MRLQLLRNADTVINNSNHDAILTGLLRRFQVKYGGRPQLARVARCVEYFSNLYTRIARQLGVNRSFVSRVARGERRSHVIEARLMDEFERFTKELVNGSNRKLTNGRAYTS